MNKFSLFFSCLMLILPFTLQAKNLFWLESWLSLVGSPFSAVPTSEPSDDVEDIEEVAEEPVSTANMPQQANVEAHEAFLRSVYHHIRENMDVAILGMSGGADSTLVAILCAEALGPENVISLHMPHSETDHRHFNARSIRTAKHLKIQTQFVPIKKEVQTLEENLSRMITLSQVNSGNLRSRVRTTLLYSVSHYTGESQGRRARVVGTGNLSEDYIGYDTKGGDALADIFPIGDLFKSEIYSLLDYFAAKGTIKSNMIDKTPSAGLWDGQTDEGELGWSYNEMEPAIRRQLQGNVLDSSVDRFVWDRHQANKHKHEAPPVFPARRFYDRS